MSKENVEIVQGLFGGASGMDKYQEFYDEHAARRVVGLENQAMSQENVETVRKLYDAWATEGFPGRLDLLDPQIEYVNPPGAIEPGVRRGLPAFIEVVEKLFEGWETWAIDPEQFRAVGDQVAVVMGYRARARQSGIEIEGRESAPLTVRAGRIVRYEWFHEPRDALRAMGLEE